jgi:putative ABC transport system substrate-binding protein
MRLIGLAVILTIGLLAAPLVAEGQQAEKAHRVGFLVTGSLSVDLPLRKLFHEHLRERGYIEGHNIAFETRAADGRTERLPSLANELVSRNVDVIVTAGTPAAVAAKHATLTVPIVMAIVSDPVGLGLVASLARPGANVTGVADLDVELIGKQMELLKETLPGLSRVALLVKADHPKRQAALREAEGAARVLGVELQSASVRDPRELDGALSKIAHDGAGAVIFVAGSFSIDRSRLVELTVKNRLPAIFWRREYVDAGGLMSYGTSYSDLYRKAASYVAKILKGAKPADLPVEQASRFELWINVKTAKTLGLTIPQSLLLRADQIIQ